MTKLIDNMSLGMRCFLVAVAAAGLMTPFILYLWIFGPLSEYSLARSDQAWANFGSFIGGTTGPVISGLAFFGVWKTFLLQKEQLAQSQRQAKIDELQRFMSTSTDKIQFILSSKRKLPTKFDSTIDEILKGELIDIINKIIQIKKTSGWHSHTIKLSKALKDHFSPDILMLKKKIEILCCCFDEFIISGGDMKVINLYVQSTGLNIEAIQVMGENIIKQEHKHYFK